MSQAGPTGDGFGFGRGFTVYLQMSEHPHRKRVTHVSPMDHSPTSYDPRLTHLQTGSPRMAMRAASHNGRGRQAGGNKQEATSDPTVVPTCSSAQHAAVSAVSKWLRDPRLSRVGSGGGVRGTAWDCPLPPTPVKEKGFQMCFQIHELTLVGPVFRTQICPLQAYGGLTPYSPQNLPPSKGQLSLPPHLQLCPSVCWEYSSLPWERSEPPCDSLGSLTGGY